MRCAAARAARRRGSSITMRRSAHQGASASASGTRVVLPAPGGATSTTFETVRRLSSSAGSASVTGRSGRGLGIMVPV